MKTKEQIRTEINELELYLASKAKSHEKAMLFARRDALYAELGETPMVNPFAGRGLPKDFDLKKWMEDFRNRK